MSKSKAPVPILVDDRDPNIAYRGKWDAVAGALQEYQHTTVVTQVKGANASYTFSGTAIRVYGTIASKSNASDPISTYSMDGKVPSTFTGTSAQNTKYNQTFFDSGMLNPGKHTLVVTNTVNGGQLWLDYFQYVPLPPSNSSSNSTGSAATARGGGSNTTTIIAGAVGGGIGGLFLLGLLVFLAMRYGRKQAKVYAITAVREDDSRPEPSATPLSRFIKPFDLTEELPYSNVEPLLRAGSITKSSHRPSSSQERNYQNLDLEAQSQPPAQRDNNDRIS